MKKISSKTTYFRKKVLPIILLLMTVIMVIYSIFFNFNARLFLFISFIVIIFSYAWFSSYRKLKEVYLGDKYLEVELEKIFFKEIISIEKTGSFCYKVIYKSSSTEKVFIFMTDLPPFYVSKYIKEIRNYNENL